MKRNFNRKIFGLILFLVLSYNRHLPAQCDKIHDSLFILHLRQKLPDFNWNSFFVIKAQTILSYYTNVPAIKRQISEIRKYQVCPNILMVWVDNGKVGDRQFKKYLSENYDINESSGIKIIVSEELADYLGGKDFPNSQVYYFYKGKCIYQHDGKYDFIPEHPLPYDFLDIKFNKRIIFEDSTYLRTNQISFFPICDRLAIELADTHQDRIRLTDLETGRVLRVFEHSQIDWPKVFADVYSRLKNLPDGAQSAEIIRKGMDFFNQIKRTPLMIDNVYVKSVNCIYLIGDLSFPRTVQKKTYVPSEYKSDKIVIKKGEWVQESLTILIETDTTFTIKNLSFIPDFEQDVYFKKHLIDPTSGVFIDGDTALFFAYNHNSFKDKTYKSFFRRNVHKEFVHRFVREGDFYKPVHKCKPRFYRDFRASYFYLGRFYFFSNDADIYLISDLYPEIYEMSERKPVGDLTAGLNVSLQYRLKQHNYDTLTSFNVPFKLLTPGLSYDCHFIYVPFIADKKLYLKAYDAQFREIFVYELSDSFKNQNHIFDFYFYPEMFFFTEHYLNVFYCDNNHCYLDRYTLEFKEVNTTTLRFIKR